jgi:NADPH:quinone reductase-like Zn-dependent oxidoreductase
MKAIVQNEYGSPDVFRQIETKRPNIKGHEVLVRVMAASINAGDLFTMRGKPWMVRMTAGLPKPKNLIPGWDLSGVVEEVGTDVMHLSPGDQVYGACIRTMAEFAAAAEDKLAVKPERLSFEQAASIPTAAVTALKGLRDAGRLQPGQRVVINGASGGVGTFAVQIAKALGAHVTAVCSTRNLDLLKSLGADEVVDYSCEDFTRAGRRYDLILDNAGNRHFSDMLHVLSPQGRIVPNSGFGGMRYVFKSFLLAPFMRRLTNMYVSVPKARDLADLEEWIRDGKLHPVIDRTYAMKEAPEAFRYMDTEHARGKVVITVKE